MADSASCIRSLLLLSFSSKPCGFVDDSLRAITVTRVQNSTIPRVANAMLLIIGRALNMLKSQIAAQGKAFEETGGFRLVLKSPCSKGRFFGLDFMPLRGRYFERSGLRTPISALFFGCGYLSTPSSRLELMRPQTRPFPYGLLRNSLTNDSPPAVSKPERNNVTQSRLHHAHSASNQCAAADPRKESSGVAPAIRHAKERSLWIDFIDFIDVADCVVINVS